MFVALRSIASRAEVGVGGDEVDGEVYGLTAGADMTSISSIAGKATAIENR